MEVSKKYVVYKLVDLLRSETLGLEKINFGWRSNFFDTEEEAIQALIEDKKHYTDYIILHHVLLTDND